MNVTEAVAGVVAETTGANDEVQNRAEAHLAQDTKSIVSEAVENTLMLVFKAVVEDIGVSTAEEAEAEVAQVACAVALIPKRVLQRAAIPSRIRLWISLNYHLSLLPNLTLPAALLVTLTLPCALPVFRFLL